MGFTFQVGDHPRAVTEMELVDLQPPLVEEVAPQTPSSAFWSAKKGFNQQMLEVRGCERKRERAESDLEQMRANLAAKEEALNKAKAAEAEALSKANEDYAKLQVAYQAWLGVPPRETPANTDAVMDDTSPATVSKRQAADSPKEGGSAKKQRKPPTDEEEEVFFSELYADMKEACEIEAEIMKRKKGDEGIDDEDDVGLDLVANPSKRFAATLSDKLKTLIQGKRRKLQEQREQEERRGAAAVGSSTLGPSHAEQLAAQNALAESASLIANKTGAPAQANGQQE